MIHFQKGLYNDLLLYRFPRAHSFLLEVVQRPEQLAELIPGFRIVNETEAELLDVMLEDCYDRAEDVACLMRSLWES
jgi:hypothetical protein